MDLTKYYPDIVAKYPAYVTKRELCEICHICPKTAYNLEQQGEIPYTIEQNHLIRSHKIKLTDILAYLYRRECRQEADSPYICAMRTFYDEHLSPYSDLLSVKDIQQITGFSSSAIVRWISTGILKAFQPGKQYCMELFGENVQIAAASHDLFAKRVNGQIYRPLVEKYIAGEKRL